MKTAETSFTVKVQNYHTKRWKSIYTGLEKYFLKKDDESLHRSRVEIKRLVALFHLIEYYNKNFDSQKKLQPLSKIFKLSGKLRDHKNGSKFRKQFKIAVHDFADNGDMQKDIRKKLKNKLKKHHHRLAKVERLAHDGLKNVEIKNLNAYLRNTKANIISYSSTGVKENKLHDIRKKIKELIYLARLDEGKAIPQSEIKVLDQLQDTIGNWHDMDKFCEKMTEETDSHKKTGPLANAKKEKQKLFLDSRKQLAAYISKYRVK